MCNSCLFVEILLYCKYVSYFRFLQQPTLHMLVHQPRPSIRSMDHTMEANKVHFSLPSLWSYSAFSKFTSVKSLSKR